MLKCLWVSWIIITNKIVFMVSVMRFVIDESFDKNEVNHYFDADIPCRIGHRIRARSGKVYRVKDVAWQVDTFDQCPDIRVLLKREE
jgi:hypothetical protein